MKRTEAPRLTLSDASRRGKFGFLECLVLAARLRQQPATLAKARLTIRRRLQPLHEVVVPAVESVPGVDLDLELGRFDAHGSNAGTSSMQAGIAGCQSSCEVAEAES